MRRGLDMMKTRLVEMDTSTKCTSCAKKNSNSKKVIRGACVEERRFLEREGRRVSIHSPLRERIRLHSFSIDFWGSMPRATGLQPP